MTDAQFKTLYNDAQKLDKDSFIEKHFISYELWNAEKKMDQDKFIRELYEIHEVANRTIKDIIEIIYENTNLDQTSKIKAFSNKYVIPLRSVENWYYNLRKPPKYLLLLIQLCEGIYYRERK